MTQFKAGDKVEIHGRTTVVPVNGEVIAVGSAFSGGLQYNTEGFKDNSYYSNEVCIVQSEQGGMYACPAKQLTLIQPERWLEDKDMKVENGRVFRRVT